MAIQYVFNPFTGELDIIDSGSTLDYEKFTLDGTDITNKYVDLTVVPSEPVETRLVVVNGGLEQEEGADFQVITDGSDIKRVSWNGLGLEPILESGDKIVIIFK